jgi:hypothetical protein
LVSEGGLEPPMGLKAQSILARMRLLVRDQ